MSLKDKTIPNDTTFVKLKDFPDGEIIKVIDCGINYESKFGPQPYFINAENERVSLPGRYIEYIEEILNNESDYRELKNGIEIVKNSRQTNNGTSTPIFTIK